MKRESKRLITGFFMLTVFFPVSLAFGGARQAQSSTGKKGLLADGNVTFTALVAGLDGQQTSYAYQDNDFTRKIVDETGINLDVTGASNADFDTKFNVMLNSGDYPDLIMSRFMSVDTMNYYAAQGIFIPLDDYKPLSYPNVAKAFQEYPTLNDKLRGSDGKLYALPAVNDSKASLYAFGKGYYFMPWVRDTGRKVPQTLDELTAHLRWIRDNDANGNGDPRDEIPLATMNGQYRQLIAVAAKAYMPFVYTDVYFGLAKGDDGRIVEQYRANEFRQALRYLNGLYKEGLILPDSFTMNADQMRALCTQDPPVLGVFFHSWSNNAMPSMTRRWIDYLPLAALGGPNGQRYGSNKDPWGILYVGYVVTDRCKDPNLAVALYNYLLDPEVALAGNFGPKGEGWDNADPGSKGRDGSPARYKQLLGTTSQRGNSSWIQEAPKIRSHEGWYMALQAVDIESAYKWFETGDPSLADRLLSNPDFYETYHHIQAMNYVHPYIIPEKYFIPPLVYSNNDNDRLAEIAALFGSYIDQACIQFINGTRNIDNNNDWNTYLKDLDNLGTPDMVRIIQAQLDKKR
jgi:putative aldouronate transport system substrate-binding protein